MHSCPMFHGELRLHGPRRAVFLDRDGVLIEDTGYPSDPDRLALLPGAGEALRELGSRGWRLVVTTNQAGVARGLLTLDRLGLVHDRLRSLLLAERVELDGLFFCPHHPDYPVAPFNIACDHRKPGPGMLRSAAARLDLDLSDCWMVGDRESDVAAAHAAGCRAVLVGSAETAAELRAADLREASGLILAR